MKAGKAVAARAGGGEEGKYVVKSHAGGGSLVECRITANDGVVAEGTSLVACSPQVTLEAQRSRPWLARVCFRPSLPLCRFGLHPGMGPRGELLLAPSLPGEVTIIHLPGGVEWWCQWGCFVACDPGIHIEPLPSSRGPKGTACVSAVGVGRLVLGSHGGTLRFDLRAGEARKVESGFLVAWTADSPSTVERGPAGGGGRAGAEVLMLQGPGTVYVQTQSVKKLAGALKVWA